MNEISLAHPANAGILAYLSTAEDRPYTGSPDGVEQPYLSLGTHPDLVTRLWNTLSAGVPDDCRWVVHGAPVLVRPSSGVIFGFATGTSTYGLRLPARERQEAAEAGLATRYVYPAGQVVDVERFGQAWVLGRWLSSEPRWCLAAYSYAAA